MDKVTMVKKEVQLQNWSETIIPYFISNLYCLSVFQGVYTAAKTARARTLNRTLPEK